MRTHTFTSFALLSALAVFASLPTSTHPEPHFLVRDVLEPSSMVAEKEPAPEEPMPPAEAEEPKPAVHQAPAARPKPKAQPAPAPAPKVTVVSHYRMRDRQVARQIDPH